MSDLIDRDLLKSRMYEEAFEKDSPMQRWDSGCWIRYKLFENVLSKIPSAEPERLTDDDFETIRIHLNACKEKLCNQRRWKEADEYQRIIDRFMAFASAEPKHEKNKRAECQYIVSKGTYSGTKNYKCTKCGDSFSWTQNEFYPWRFNYCRNCGSKVVGCIEEEAEHE